jgi:hypothetical protein|tara:strand:+ start:353 stop:838 length:486 start_codon:yes stop_codon:yes gene_type:complete
MWGVMVLSYILMGISFVSIIIAALSAYLSIDIYGASHILIALYSSIIYMFTETLIMFYFIITGVKIKEFIKVHSLDIVDHYKPVIDMKIKLFPNIMINMIIIGATFILHGAVDNNIISSFLHLVIYILGIAHFTWLIFLQHRCFIKNTELVILVYELANDN